MSVATGMCRLGADNTFQGSAVVSAAEQGLSPGLQVGAMADFGC